MKKLLVLFSILNIALCLAFAADSKTYTFGSVKISQDNELPSGYFSKAKNYLPGDSISISNPQNGAEVSVLNLGTLDDSEDAAILIAPEVASKLGIDFSVQLRIKLSPRPDDFDEIAAGSGVLSYGASVYADEETVPENTFDNKPVSKVKEEPVVSYVTEETFDEVEDDDFTENTDVPETAYESDVEDEDYTEPLYVSETSVDAEEEQEEEKNIVETRIEPIADLSALDEKVEEEVVPEEEPVIATESESFAEKAIASAPVVADVAKTAVEDFEDPEPVVIPEKKEEKLEPVYDSFEPVKEEFTDYFLTETEPVTPKQTVETPVDTVPLEKITTEPLEAIVETGIETPAVQEQEKKPEKASAVIEKFNDEPVAAAEPFNFADSIETDAIKDEPEVKVIAETDDSEDEEFEDEEEEVYVPEIEEIVETTSVFSLNPTDAVVPKYDPKYARQQPKPKAKTAPKKEEPKKKVETPVETSKPKPVPEKKDVIIKDKNLRNGSYYVQIATVTTSDAGMKIVNRYDKYPIILVPFDTREGYKVMVGPLTGDEYGAALEKFKAFGYRDAFVRKIK